MFRGTNEKYLITSRKRSVIKNNKSLDSIQIKEIDYSSNCNRIAKIVNEVYLDELKYCSEEYSKDKYEDTSTHFFAVKGDEPIGYMRMIRPSAAGFPCLEYAKLNIELDLSRCVEYSKGVVKKEYRNTTQSTFHRVSFLLGIEAIKQTVFNDYFYILADTFIESDVYRLWQFVGFKECSKPYKDPRYLVDGLSVLLFINMPECFKMFLLQKYVVEKIAMDPEEAMKYLVLYESEINHRFQNLESGVLQKIKERT